MQRSPVVPGRILVGIAVLLGVGGMLACAPMQRRHFERRHGFQSEVTRVEMVSAKVGEKNVFIPSTVVLTAGEGRVLSIFNTTDVPHGFHIAALGVEVVLQPGQETEVALPALEAGRIHALGCHLHPPHRGGTLVVLPARD